jgi:gliding motility-associated-like protein
MEGCNLSGSNQQVALNISGTGNITVSYDLIYTSANKTVSDTTHLQKTFILKESQDSAKSLDISIPPEKYGQYKLVITNIHDKVSVKSGILACKSDIPANPIVFNVFAQQPNPIYASSDQSLVCVGDKIWYYSEEKVNWKYNWNVTGGNILANNNDSIEVLWNAEGSQSIQMNTITPEGCVSEYAYEQVQVAKATSLFNDKSAVICERDSFLLKPSASFDSIKWDNGSNASFISIKQQGAYSAEAKLIGGCTVRDTFFLRTEPGLAFSLGNDTVLCGNQQILLDPGTIANTYEWSTGETTPTIRSYAGAGNIWVKLSNNYGCISSDTIHIGLCQPQSLAKEIPNAFTPNNDGDNDTWRIELLDAYPGAVVSIYNRWGQIVYKNNSYPAEGWDGTSNGKDLPMSTYFYVIELNNGSSPIVGSVNVIR